MATTESRDRERDLGKILNNVEEELNPTIQSPSTVERFAPQKYRSERGDSMEQIKQDFRKSVADLESRFKSVLDELKRIMG